MRMTDICKQVSYLSGTNTTHGISLSRHANTTICLRDGEVITKIMGNADLLVYRLTFVTNLNATWGPYGGEGGSSFTITGNVISFFGYRDTLGWLTAIGVWLGDPLVPPLPSPGQSPGPGPPAPQNSPMQRSSPPPPAPQLPPPSSSIPQSPPPTLSPQPPPPALRPSPPPAVSQSPLFGGRGEPGESWDDGSYFAGRFMSNHHASRLWHRCFA
jgi:hypothetical protein